MRLGSSALAGAQRAVIASAFTTVKLSKHSLPPFFKMLRRRIFLLQVSFPGNWDKSTMHDLLMTVVFSDTRWFIYLRCLKVIFSCTLNDTIVYKVASPIGRGKHIYRLNVSWSFFLEDLLFLDQLGVLSLLWVLSYSLQLWQYVGLWTEHGTESPHLILKMSTY